MSALSGHRLSAPAAALARVGAPVPESATTSASQMTDHVLTTNRAREIDLSSESHQCFACGAWHSGWHTVDGERVPSLYCQPHATLEWRAHWLVGPAEDDPRLPTRRFAPSHVRASRRSELLEALARRPDVRPAPEPVAVPLITDMRRAFVPLSPPLEQPAHRRRRRGDSHGF